MSRVARWWWLFGVVVLAIASGAALALVTSGEAIPSVVRDPIFTFVQPGVTVWWLVLGGPFRTVPFSTAGIVFAAGANAALWSMVLWFGVAIVRAARRKLTR